MDPFIELISDSIMGFFWIWRAHFGWYIRVLGAHGDNILLSNIKGTPEITSEISISVDL